MHWYIDTFYNYLNVPILQFIGYCMMELCTINNQPIIKIMGKLILIAVEKIIHILF